MKIDTAQLVSALSAAALPMAEKDAIVAVDTILKNIQSQAASQMGDTVATVVAMLIPAIQPAIDAELAKLLPLAGQ